MIDVPVDIRDAMVSTARVGSPAEICGVLGGTYDTDRSRVRSQYRVKNVASRPRTRYRLDPEESLEIFDRLEARGEEIVGFYHSHPRGPLEPSATDTALATWPNRSYVIVSLEGMNGNGADSMTGETAPRVGSWRWHRSEDSGSFERERIHLV